MVVDEASWVKISTFICLGIFSLSDLMDKSRFSSPWHMLLFDCKSFASNGVKGGLTSMDFRGCSH